MGLEIIDKYGSKRVFFSLLLVILLINSLLLCVLIRKEKTVTYKGNKIMYQERKNRNSIFKDKEGNILTVKPIDIVIEGKEVITDDLNSSYEIDYKDKQILYDNSKFMDMETKITLFDGSIYESAPISLDYNNKQSNGLPDDVKLSYDVINVHNSTKGILGHLGDIILGAVAIIIGLVNLIYPKEIWQFKHKLDVKGGEPTDYAIISSQIGGMFFILIPTICLVFVILI